MENTTKKKTSTSSKKMSSSSTSKKKSTSTKKATSSVKKQVNNSIINELSSVTGIDKSLVRKGVNKTSKLSTGGKISVVLCLAIGLAGGYFGIRLLQKNDQFRLVNGETYSVNVGDTLSFNNLSDYVICVSYSMNAINSVSYSIKDSSDTQVNAIDTSKEGTYTITYTSSNIKYKSIALTQTINVTNAENSYVGD